MANSPYLMDTNSQNPQANQYSSGNSPDQMFNQLDNNYSPYQTSVLNPSNTQPKPAPQQSQPTNVNPPSDGTALGNIGNWNPNPNNNYPVGGGIAGGLNNAGGINNGTVLGNFNPNPTGPDPNYSQAVNYGNAPAGFDANKWNDPNSGNSNKYVVGRILASGGTIQQAANAVGARVIAPDKIQYPDGFVADVYYDYGGPQQRVQYLDQTPYGDSSVLGTGQQGGGLFDSSSILQLLYSMLNGNNPQQTMQNQSTFQNRYNNTGQNSIYQPIIGGNPTSSQLPNGGDYSSILGRKPVL